jgi:DNA-binding transcriptional ArsR family regulator
MMDGRQIVSTDKPQPELYPDFRPEPAREIADVETLRAISDPTRMRLLETLVQRQDPPWSVKELAAAMGVPQTRLYHHVELLAQHDLVRPVERRVVSGIIETRYRVAALSFRLDRRLFAGDPDESRRLIHDAMVAVFDTARDEIEAAMRSGVIDPSDTSDERLLVTRGLTLLSPARSAEYRRRLLALNEEFGDESPGRDDPEAHAWGVVVAIYPLSPSMEPSDA